MDEIRRQITERIEELGLTPRRVSLNLGKHPGYMHEWLTGKQQNLPYEVRLMLANELRMEARKLGVAPIEESRPQRGFGEDEVAVYEPAPDDVLARQPHIAYFKMRSRALDQHIPSILPGVILAFDINKSDPAKIPSGSIVVVQLYAKSDLLVSKGTIIRQFIAPNKLITNSSIENEIRSLDDPASDVEAVIKGAMVGRFDGRN